MLFIVLIHYICTNYLIHIITLMMIFWSSEKQARIGQWLGGKSTSMYFVFCILYHCHKNINEPFQCWQTNHINLISQSVYTCVISNWHSLLYIDIVIIYVIYCHILSSYMYEDHIPISRHRQRHWHEQTDILPLSLEWSCSTHRPLLDRSSISSAPFNIFSPVDRVQLGYIHRRAAPTHLTRDPPPPSRQNSVWTLILGGSCLAHKIILAQISQRIGSQKVG